MRSLEEIIDLGSRFYGIRVEVLVSRKREEKVALTRFSIMKVCREEGYKLAAIGRAFNRDHGTVLHGLREVNAEKFGPYWTQHEQFVAIAHRDSEPEINPMAGLLNDIDVRLANVQIQIDSLEGMKKKLLETRELISVKI